MSWQIERDSLHKHYGKLVHNPKPGIRRRYYTVDIPSDCETDPDRRFELAIIQLKSDRPFPLVGVWNLVWDDGENVRIRHDSQA